VRTIRQKKHHANPYPQISKRLRLVEKKAANIARCRGARDASLIVLLHVSISGSTIVFRETIAPSKASRTLRIPSLERKYDQITPETRVKRGILSNAHPDSGGL